LWIENGFSRFQDDLSHINCFQNLIRVLVQLVRRLHPAALGA